MYVRIAQGHNRAIHDDMWRCRKMAKCYVSRIGGAPTKFGPSELKFTTGTTNYCYFRKKNGDRGYVQFWKNIHSQIWAILVQKLGRKSA